MKKILFCGFLALRSMQSSLAFRPQLRQFHSSSLSQRSKKNLLSMKKHKDPYENKHYEFCEAKNAKQQKYIDHLNEENTKILFAVGPAGTGKTLIACNHALKLLTTGEIKRIVITRPVVPVEEEEIGFLPGNLNKKMDPWLRPLFDTFLEIYSQTQIDRMIYDNIIEIAPLAFMRGRTFKNTLIIADEMQNSTPNQMLMLLTRVGSNSKLIVTGDIKQTDISKEKESGLSDVVKKTKKYIKFMLEKYGESSTQDQSIQIVEFTNKDIERSKVVKKILDVYNIDKIVKAVKKEKEIENSKNDDCAMIPKKEIDHLEKKND